jgi:hypothetical protein
MNDFAVLEQRELLEVSEFLRFSAESGTRRNASRLSLEDPDKK